ncbi:MAG: hypothetical protein K0R93_704 [Anaerosolibacter sp.]|jgi:hypothetical protein|nr:hypothetical protein [Anaerosolibacter sp.]
MGKEWERMTDQVRQYCAQSIVRYLNGDFAEFDRLAAMAEVHNELEEMKNHLHFRIGEVIPQKTIEVMYMRAVA